MPTEKSPLTTVSFVESVPPTVNVDKTVKSPAVENDVLLDRNSVRKSAVDTTLFTVAVESVLKNERIVNVLWMSKLLKRVADVNVENVLNDVRLPPICRLFVEK